ncbi:MAG: FAD:protein FMN transferase, partial [Lachnospiraceae bacterium]|nr:FAD:protein FMN transferase [Lachnospiraceae bacterium]
MINAYARSSRSGWLPPDSLGCKERQLNEKAGEEQGMPVSAELEEILRECMELSRESDGAFDVSVGALSVLW